MGKQATDITIFHFANNVYTKKIYHVCYWEDDQAANIKKSGLANADSLYISIPWVNTGLDVTKGKDYVIKGTTNLEIDNTSQKTQSESINALNAAHDMFTITNFSEKTHCSRRMWHWELSGK